MFVSLTSIRSLVRECARLRIRKVGHGIRIVATCFFATFICLEVFAANKPQHPAQRLVEEALSREIYGLTKERTELLRQASELSPSYAPAKWHQGMVRFNNRWLRAEEVPARIGESRWLNEYQKVRGQYPQTAQGQMALANWCRERNLRDQERAHLTHTLDFQPDHVDALLRLGFQPVNGRWIKREELEKSAQQRERERVELSKWTPRMQNIFEGLNNRSRRRREVAQRQLNDIDNAAAIPAMTKVLATSNPQVADLVVKKLGAMSGSEATKALTKLAVFGRWTESRDSAARNLGQRQREAYVPAMLAAMHTPIDTRRVSFFQGGRIMHLVSMTREGQDEKEQVVAQSHRRNAAGAMVHLENYRTQVINERVARALNLANEMELTADPKQWWAWWNDTNEIFVEGEKPTVSVGLTDQLARVDRARELEDLQRARESAERARRAALMRQQLQQAASSSSIRPQRRRDCLAAGTIVWTATGAVAVESVQVGDLVLSQDSQTGELAYKPVLRTTIRPTSLLVKINAGGETIEASGGHPFWIAGEGWVKARDLKAGMEMHCINGTRCISAVTSGANAQTYNLVVADFNTYFIGQAKILNHDNTIREATEAIVPGLIER